MADNNSSQDGVSTLQNAVRQIGLIAQSIANVAPSATTTLSPKFWGFNALGTTATTLLLSASTVRHGLYFHVPSTTAQVLVYASNINAAPTTSAPGGAFLILGCGSLQLSAANFPNLNCTWIGQALTGSGQPLTVVEFF